ncbi:aminoglycoside phosphotransferase family protein [Geodermatophilus sp. SYSU D00742]
MTAAHPDPLLEKVLESLTRELHGTERTGPRLTLLSEPMRTARSTLYTVQASPSGTTYVIKVPAPGDDAVDTEPPLDAETQFAALRRAHAWYRDDGAAPVSRPVALLEDVGAVVMEHVPGPTVGQAVHRAPLHPWAAARAVAAAGRFLREFHRHAQPGATVSLSSLAQDVVTADRALLSPVGVRLPAAVRRTLLEMPDVAVPAGRVLLHGDYVPNNLIITGRDSVTMLDPLLVRLGLPEDDAARFLAIVSSDTALVPGVAWPPIRSLRRHLESEFRLAYGNTVAHPAILELRLLQQHVLRWRRRREFSTLTQYPSLMKARARVIDSHMRALLRESGHRLARSLQTSRPRRRVAAG